MILPEKNAAYLDLAVGPFAAEMFARFFVFCPVLKSKKAKKRCCKFALSLFGPGQSK